MPKKQKFDYFEAFYQQAQFAAQTSQAMVDILGSFQPETEGWMREQLDQVHEIEKQADALCHDITEHLAVEFMPPIDREDVSELAFMLDDVTDLIEDVVQHLYIHNIMELHPQALTFATYIDEAVDTLTTATKAFREFRKPKKLYAMLIEVHDKESVADDLYQVAKRDLFTNHANDPAAYLISWDGMFSHMEACTNTCAQTATLMQTIALKNS